MADHQSDPQEQTIFSVDLATPLRTIAGVLGTAEISRVPRDQQITMLTAAGLPVEALDAPDFPISLDQESRIFLAWLRYIDPAASSCTAIFGNAEWIDIGRFGLVGLAMQHAPSLEEAIRVVLENPQLVWGRSRLSVTSSDSALRLRFEPIHPVLPGTTDEDIARLAELCLLWDLASSVRMIADILGPGHLPDSIALCSPRPADWVTDANRLTRLVRFDADATIVAYPAETLSARPVKANRVSFLSYRNKSRRRSETLRSDITIAEQVSRWLWAATPPMRSGDIARRLGMSERSLARGLMAEGTSYRALLQQVQGERARNLLRSPSATAASVAYRMGYSDPAAFSRAFASWTGETPGAWKATRKTGEDDGP